LRGAPDHVFVPMGGGGLFVATWRGFRDFLRDRRIEKLPAMHAAQPAGCPTISGPLREGKERAIAVNCTTKISGLQVPLVLDGDLVIRAARETGGSGQLPTDEQIHEA